MSGFGYQVGGARPDIGDGFVELRCDNVDCEATWVGPVGEDCAYCIPEAAERRWKASQRWHEIGEQMIADAQRQTRKALAALEEVGL